MATTENHRLILQEPCLTLKEAFLAALSRLSPSEQLSLMAIGMEHDSTWPFRDFEGYLSYLLHTQDNPKPGWVRSRSFWACRHNNIVGRITVRQELNDELRRINGHIGYITVPWERGQGVATEMLQTMCTMDIVKSIMPVLLTCDEDNVASERVIVKNGGVYESTIEAGHGRARKKRFWIRASEQ
jgi:predicted acetyltransferase